MAAAVRIACEFGRFFGRIVTHMHCNELSLSGLQLGVCQGDAEAKG